MRVMKLAVKIDKKSLNGWIIVFIICAVIVTSFYKSFFWMLKQWFAAEQYSPGPLIPLMGIIILWHKLKKLKNRPKFSKDKLKIGGVIVVVLAATVYLCTQFMEENDFSRLIIKFSYAVLFLGLTFLLLYCAIMIMRDDENHMEEAKKLSNNIIGAVFISLALIVHFFAQRGDLPRMSIIAYLGLLFGLTWFFCGKQTAADMLFPLAFLLFMTPLEFLDDFVGGPLRILATRLSTFVMKMIGLSVSFVRGTVFGIKDMQFGVEEACSGLRSLIALSAIGATFAYVTQPTVARKYFIGLCALPIAVMTNVIRLVFVGIGAQFFGEKTAMAVHDNSIVLYVLAILLLFSLDRLFRIEWLKIENF